MPASRSNKDATPLTEGLSDLARAQALHRAGRLAEAEAMLDVVIAANPVNAEAWAERGLLDFERGRLESAARFTFEAAALAPGVALYPARLGAIRNVEGRHVEALQFYRRALALPSDQSQAFWHEIGNIYFALGDDREAAAAYRNALQIAPNSTGTLHNLGNALTNLAAATMHLQTSEEAIALYRRALSIAPKFTAARQSMARAYMERARILLARGDTNGALNGVRDALRVRGAAKAPKLMLAQRQTDGGAPAIAARRFENSLVLAGDRAWYVLTRRNEIHIDDMSNATAELEEYVRLSVPTRETIVQLDHRRVVVKDPCFLLGGSRNYYHWMVDYLPRLAAPEAATGWPLLVNDDLTEFQRACLSHLSISDDRLRRVPMPAIIETGELIAPPVGCVQQRLRHGVAAWLRDAFVAGSAPAGGARRIYVSRRDSLRRRLVNEEEAIAALALLDFEIVVPGTMSVVEQARLFAGAAIIVGVHGAGLTNMIFAPARATIIELGVWRRYRPSFMKTLAASLGLTYHAFSCWPLPTAAQHGTVSEQDYDMIAPVPALLQLVANVSATPT
jgi:capsular polysaccharide biosynthesis protein/Tfp pilus assembly protein PilF